MLNINADSVILSKSEYMALLEEARRKLAFTRAECDAIIFAIRKLSVADIYGETPDEKIHHLNTLVNVAKKLEGY